MTVEELNKALAAFLIAFGSALPPELARRARDLTSELADSIDRGGEPTVARLARGFGNALAETHEPRNR